MNEDPDSINRLNAHHETPLLVAVGANDIKQTKKLVRLHANVNLPDQNGWTPLHDAAQQGNIPITRFLLASGANLEARNSYQETPLIVAALATDNMAMVHYLLKHGANMDAKDDDGHCIRSYMSKDEILVCENI